MQNLTGPELLALEQQSDGHSHVGYVTEGGKRSQRSVGGVGDGEQGEGSKVDSNVLPSRTRPLTTSFLLDLKKKIYLAQYFPSSPAPSPIGLRTDS